MLERYNKLHRTNYPGKLDNSRLERYFQTKTLQKLKGRGMFCGMDYVGIKKLIPNAKYTRYDHSKNVAYSGWTLSEDLKVALTGGFHDVGTQDFSHVNSFKKGESLTQENDELDIKTILNNDEEILEYLFEDKLTVDDVCDYSKYPLLDKEIPSLCLDRVDGILSTCLFFAKTHSIEEIENLYYMLTYFENLNGMVIDLSVDRLKNFNGEIVLSECGEASYEDFFRAISCYSKLLLSKESRYVMELFGIVLRFYEDVGVIEDNDLFNLSEEEVIAKILDSKYRDIWLDFTSMDKVRIALPNQRKGLILYSKPKIRQANPLCFGQMTVCEIDGISGDFYRELVNLYKDIERTDKPLVGNLCESTVKVLSKYKKFSK